MLLFTPSAGFGLPSPVSPPPSFPLSIYLFIWALFKHRRKLMIPSSSSPELPQNGAPAYFIGGHSLADLQQIPAELWLTRRRIEAGVRDQRRQREILAQVQRKLAQCRLERAQRGMEIDEEAQIGPRARSHSPTPSSSFLGLLNPFSIYSLPIPSFSHQFLPERPNTSHLNRRRAFEEEEEFVEFGEEEWGQNGLSNQFR
jgi:hypothetical protein